MRNRVVGRRLWNIVGPVLPLALLLGFLTVSASSQLDSGDTQRLSDTLKNHPMQCKAVDDATLAQVQTCGSYLLGVLKKGNSKTKATADDVQSYLIANVSYYKTVQTSKPAGPGPSKGEWVNTGKASQQLIAFAGTGCADEVGGVVGSAPGSGGRLTKSWQFNNQVVYHSTDAKNKCTLFYTASGDGKSGRIVGYGFHTDINKQSLYKLDYIDPYWKVPAQIDINGTNPGT